VVYVDELRTYGLPRTGQARRYGTSWCHMATDGELDELHAFAERIGLQRRWFQPHLSVPHYDLSPSRRSAAVAGGAIEVSSVDLVRRCKPARAGREAS